MLASLKHVVLASLGAVLRRRVVLLPREAGEADSMLEVLTPYRVDANTVAFECRDARGGQLTIAARGYEGHFPGEVIWQSGPLPFAGGSMRLSLDLASGTLSHGERPLSTGAAPLAIPTRRFVLDFALERADGSVMRRRTGHYLSGGERPVDASYFQGDNYVDHDAQSAGDAADVLRLLNAHAVRGRVLEVGCATGSLVRAMRNAGWDAVGADFSEWAIDEARQRLGGEHAWVWNVDLGAAPAALAARGPFDAVVLWVTLEHFREPWNALAAVTPYLASGARLFIKTTNADSLTRVLFGGDWEGHFDWTHHGVEAVGVRTLRERLPALGWRIRSLVTERIWDGSADPTHATLRDWWDADARFRALVVSKELGDLVTVVAERA